MSDTNEIQQLKTELWDAKEVANNARAKAMEQFKEACEKIEKRLAAAIASEIGVGVGSIVLVKRSIGYGTKQRIQTTRYRVESIGYKGYGTPPVSLIARTIRKDGTDGDKHEIWHSWTVEKTEEK